MEQCPANYTPLTPLSFLERASRVYGDCPSIIYGTTTYTWSQTFLRCTRLASALVSSLRIRHGDVVAVMAPNIPAMYEMHFGVPMAGAILNTLNIRLDARTLAVLLRHSDAKAVFVDSEFLPLAYETMAILSSASPTKTPTIVVIRDGALSDKEELDYESLLKNASPDFQISWPNNEWDSISLNYTSGTTAKPKGVVYHHRGAYLTCLALIILWKMKERPVYLWTVPMFHCNGWCLTWTVAAQGGVNVCLRHVTAKDAYEAINKHNVTHMACAPVVLNILASHSANKFAKPMSSKVEVITGGAPPPPSILARMENLGFNVTHSYGLTETFGPALYCRWKAEWDLFPVQEQAKLKARQGVSHLALADTDVKNPTTMRSVPHDGKTVGEVMLRGSTIMKGYFRDGEASESAFEGGWFHTGDLGVIHPDGYIQLKDRSKDIIISGGENISSIEVETVLYAHPDIAEAAVVAQPHEFWGETPCAFVSLKDGHHVSAQSILAYCRDHLPHYMVPSSVVFGALPKTATGKIQKNVLREKAKLGVGERNQPKRVLISKL